MLSERLVTIEEKLHGLLVRHAIKALRITVGAIFLGFGVLKFFPDVSPAQGLSIKTIDLLTFGLIPWEVGIVVIAALECFIGICLLANRWMRVAVWLLVVQFIGILAPLVLLTGRLFSGLYHAPTLEGQYVLKDIILVAAGMAIAAGTFRGGRLIRDEPEVPVTPPAPIAKPADEPDASHKLQIVLSAAAGERTVQDGVPTTSLQNPTVSVSRRRVGSRSPPGGCQGSTVQNRRTASQRQPKLEPPTRGGPTTSLRETRFVLAAVGTPPFDRDGCYPWWWQRSAPADGAQQSPRPADQIGCSAPISGPRTRASCPMERSAARRAWSGSRQPGQSACRIRPGCALRRR